MPIKYCCVSAAVDGANTKLAEYPADEQPAMAETMQKIFGTTNGSEYRRRALEDKKGGVGYYMLANGDGKFVGCVVTSDTPARVAYAFLEAVEALVRPANTDVRSVKKILQQKADYYSDPKNDKFTAINQSINEVTEVMRENMDKVLQRGERIDNIHGKSEDLVNQAQTFESKANELKKKLCWRNAKLTVMVVLGVGIAILIIVMMACKPNFSDCK